MTQETIFQTLTEAALEARKQIEISKGVETLEVTKNFEEKTNEAISSILEKNIQKS